MRPYFIRLGGTILYVALIIGIIYIVKWYLTEMRKRSNLSKFRNFSYFRLFGIKCNLSSLLINLEPDCKCITDEEKQQLLEIRDSLNSLLSRWKNTSVELINQVKE